MDCGAAAPLLSCRASDPMLKLERLELSGFKSFVDPVKVVFAGGITAIVGPNGCGKSNLADAMTWVLGEQSAKSLRGGTMEDVIFNGSEQRKPLGMGEVTLQLRAHAGALATELPSTAAPRATAAGRRARRSVIEAEEGRITIGRRVYRGGESQYRLNGRTVRLKDVRDLLMDTGLGIRAYSVIEQGKIGLILSGKPQERRKLLEEAAGITRYKVRKGLAEVKLEEATANLLRLDDVISEVERALRSLKRQAGAARRYQQAEGEYRGLLDRVLRGRWAALTVRLDGVRGGLDDAVGRDAEQAAGLHRDEAALAAGRETLESIARQVAERHQRQADLGTTIEGRQQLLKGHRRAVEEIVERAAQAAALAERRQEELGRLDAALAELAERRASLAEERDLAAAAVSADEREIAAAEAGLRQAQAGLEAGRADLLARTAELNALRGRLQQAQMELERGSFRQHHLDEELDRRGHELAAAEEALALARQKVVDLEAALAERAAEHERVASALTAAMRREAEAVAARRELEDRLSGLRQRQAILAELARAHEERRAALDEAVRAGYAALRGGAAGGGSNALGMTSSGTGHAATALGGDEAPDEPPAAAAPAPAAPTPSPVYLATRAQAVEGWEHALDFFLGALADAVVLDPEESPLALARALAGGRSGAILLAPQRSGPAATGSDEAAASDISREAGSVAAPVIDDPAIVLTLGEALGLPTALAAALPPAYLVEAAADAARLASTHPGVDFLSRQGVWVEGGTFHVEGESAAPGILERRRELERLERELPQVEAALVEALEVFERRVAERAALAGDANRLQGVVAQLRQELAVAHARQEDAAHRHGRLAAEQAELDAAREETGRELARTSSRREGLDREAAAAGEAARAAEERLAAAEAEVDAAKAGRESLRAEGAARKGRLELLDERLAAHDREAGRLGSDLDEGRRQVAGWVEETERLTARRARLEEEIERAERELHEALEQRAAAEEAVLAEQARLDAERQTIQLLEVRIAGERERREVVRHEIEELRVEQAGLKQDAEHLRLSYLEEFGWDLMVGPRAAQQQVPGEAGIGAEAAAGVTMDGDAEEAAALVLGSAEEGWEKSGWDQAAPPAPLAAVEVVELVAIDPADLPLLEADLARCKATLERLGPVNALAVQEHDEQEQRQTFLTTQRADVAQSVDSLRATIREINLASSQRFLETFVEVNRHFAEVFVQLFRGGEAEMRLMDEDDVLECGIEIVARPPGKRLQNLMLLSGGEKALTAIALLFALFRTKPSPFCILDEVDAPLDDVNTRRFVELLRQMSTDTQFLVITHNKITMEVASTLYGVTMEEKGVSKLVAVQIEELQPEPQAATA